MLKEMCKLAGIEGNFTNHSLRAYGATKLFQSHVPEKLIQQRTGHRSLDALRLYERITESQLVDASNHICNASPPVDTNSCSPMPQVSNLLPQVSNLQSHTSNAPTATLTPTVASSATPPAVLFNGCTFTACAISMSGQAVHNSSIDELFEGIDVNEIFDD